MIIRANDTIWNSQPSKVPDVAAPASRCVCIRTNTLTLEAHCDELPPPPAERPDPEDPQPAAVLCRMVAGMHGSIREVLLGTDVDGLPLHASLSIMGAAGGRSARLRRHWAFPLTLVVGTLYAFFRVEMHLMRSVPLGL